jgi:hypothetical protein
MPEYFVDQSVQAGPAFVDRKAVDQRVDHDILSSVADLAIS